MGDWRETLFVWDGALNKLSENEFSWEGYWQPFYTENDDSTIEDLMKEAQLKTSEYAENKFQLKASLNNGLCSFEGSYQLDQGEGHVTVRDKRHLCHFFRRGEGSLEACDTVSNIDGETYTFCAAWGNTEFGKFVSRGFTYTAEGGYTRLQLARRYLAASDPRAKVQKKDMKKSFRLQQNLSLKSAQSRLAELQSYLYSRSGCLSYEYVEQHADAAVTASSPRACQASASKKFSKAHAAKTAGSRVGGKLAGAS